MAPKSLALAALLVLVAAAGQVSRGAALGANPNASVVIFGAVPCATGNNINVATAPAFPNATVQFVCNGKAVAAATSDGSGAFNISVPSANRDQLTAIMNNQCNLVVATPLAACDASLAGATGKLVSPVKFMGITTGSGGGSGDDIGLGGLINVIIGILSGLLGGILNLVPQGFSVASSI